MRYLLLLSILISSLAEAQPVRVCIIGDSISAGSSPATRSWSKDLASRIGGDAGVKPLAEPAYTAAQGAARAHTDVVGRGCTHVVIMIGTNDAGAGTAAATVYATINTLATLLEAGTGVNGQPTQVILAAAPPRGTSATWTAAKEAIRTSLNALLAARGGATIYVDMSTALTGTASGTAWQASTTYSLDNVRVNGGNAYICTTAGDSAGSGGPTGTGTGIEDGTAVWDYIPALGTEWGGATDGLHPNDTGMAKIALEIHTAVVAAGGWR